MMTAASPKRATRVERQEFLPTILIATEAEWSHPLAHMLQLDGYVAFEASGEAEALVVVISQSRPIHILLVDDNIDGQQLARTLKLYRREMQVLFITANSQQSFSDGLHPQIALAKVRKMLELPQEIATDANRTELLVQQCASPSCESGRLHAVQRVTSSRSGDNQQEFRTVAREAAIAHTA
jgi:CheY-like chemotaxis protein